MPTYYGSYFRSFQANFGKRQTLHVDNIYSQLLALEMKKSSVLFYGSETRIQSFGYATQIF